MKTEIMSLIGIVLVIALVAFGLNMCTSDEWNGGECPKCDTRYELRGVSKYTKYYACPECGNEVRKY